MGWGRIAIFSILLFVSTVTSVAIFTFLTMRFGYSSTSKGSTVISTFIIPWSVGFLVFITLAFKQLEKPYIHASLVYLFSMIIGVFITLVVIQLPIDSSIWVATNSLNFIVAMLATFIGIKLRGEEG